MRCPIPCYGQHSSPLYDHFLHIRQETLKPLCPSHHMRAHNMPQYCSILIEYLEVTLACPLTLYEGLSDQSYSVTWTEYDPLPSNLQTAAFQMEAGSRSCSHRMTYKVTPETNPAFPGILLFCLIFILPVSNNLTTTKVFC